MSVVTFPSQGSTSWFSWATDVDRVARATESAPAAITTLQNTTPTIEELFVSKDITSASLSAASSQAVLTAPFPLKVLSASIAFWGGSSITADDTNYWTVDLRKGTGTTFATKNTKVTGGQGISTRTDWNFDAVTFDSAGATFAKGNILAVYLTPTGTPTAIGAGANITVRYSPL